MASCTACKKKFLFFKLNKTKCMECGNGFCHICIKRGLKTYCESCFILNTRPVNPNKIMSLRSKDIKKYLARRDVSTDSCIEKQELVNRFIAYIENETPRQSRFNSNYLNGLMNTLTSSMPNLFEGRNTTAQTRRTVNEASSSAQPCTQPSAPLRFDDSEPESVPAVSISNTGTTTTTATTTTTTTTTTMNSDTASTLSASAVESNNSPRIDPKRIKLSEINNQDEIQHLSVKQLKRILLINRVDFKGCVEKDELIGRVVKLWEQSQNEKPDELSNADLCKICMDAPLNCVLLECGHICTCIECGKQLTECPICRQYVVRVVHTFKA